MRGDAAKSAFLKKVPGRMPPKTLARKLSRLHPNARLIWFAPRRTWAIVLRGRDGQFQYWKSVGDRPTYQNTLLPLNEASLHRLRYEHQRRSFLSRLDQSVQDYLARKREKATDGLMEGLDRTRFRLGIDRLHRVHPWPSGEAPKS